MPDNRSTLDRHRARFEGLKQLRRPWEAQWQELADYISPTRLRLELHKGEGQKLRGKIVDSTGTFTLRTLQSGMHSGMTSPARPWFRSVTTDPDLREFGPVKEYLDTVDSRIREVFQASNFYNAFHTGYGDEGLFGQSAGLMIDDREQFVRMQQYIHGSFWLACDERSIVNTLYRQFSWTVENVVKRFGLERCSITVRNLYAKSQYDQWVPICHAVEPRRERDASKADKRNMPWLSNYWEEGASQSDGMLEESGFPENPIIAPRWDVIGDDIYGVAPMMDGLPDVKMLQKQQEWKGEAVEQGVRPAMVAPVSFRSNPKSRLPGQTTYVDDAQGTAFRRAFDIQLQLGDLREDIRDTQERIKQAGYADLFLMLANMEGVQPRNQFEIAERKEEKLLALGPVLERLQNEKLGPAIDRAYAILNRRHQLPPPPKELQGQDLKIDYVSVLAQAQKAVATGTLERFWTFVGSLAGAKPDVLDKVDADQSVDEYADMIGVPSSIIVPDDKVTSIRQDRADAQQKAAAAETAAKLAPAAKDGMDAIGTAATLQNNGSAGQLLNQVGLA